MVRKLLLTVPVLLACGATAPAVADDAQDCINKTGDARIAACTRVINSKKFSGTSLGNVHHYRASGHREKNDNDKALIDYDTAIRLNPKNHNALVQRGTIYRIKGDHERALADYDQAIRVEPV